MRMCNIMKFFMSEVKRVDIDKLCWKSKMEDWVYLSAINVGIMCRMISISNTWLITKEKNSQKKVYNRMSYSNIFQNPKNALFKNIQH